MKDITLIGSGNVSYHLCKTLSDLGFQIKIFARNKLSAQEFVAEFNVELISTIEELKDQLVLVCVSDASISSIISALDDSNRIAYTSGNQDLNSLVKRKNLGVFYPLQTFSKEREVNLFDVPFLIEANNSYFTQELFDLAWQISKKVEFADSQKRKSIHIAAVFANNFTNHLLFQAKKLLEEKEIDWSLLHPLIQETILKAIELGPENSQTGPAKRNDLNTIENQLEQLNPELKQIYLNLSNSILENYGHKKL